MHESDLDLWPSILNGDSIAWGKLVTRYQSLVYTVATRSGLSMSDAADCFQQTWVALYKNRARIQDPTRIAAWLVTTAKREAQHLRRRVANDGVDTGDSETVDPDPLPDEELLQLERQAQLGIALGELDARCRKLVEAFFYADEDKTYEQIAASLGIASNSLGPIRRRCLERLKQILVRNGFSDGTK
jgi:RNA polymerase sigma factor (sigma-70 family)